MSCGKIGSRSLTADCSLKFHGKQQSTLMAWGIFSYSKALIVAGLRLAQKEKNLTGAFSHEINEVVLNYMKSPNDTLKTFLATNITEM